MNKIVTFFIGLLLGMLLIYSTEFVIDLNKRINILERQNLLLKTKVLDLEEDCETLAEFLLKYFTDTEEKSVFRQI